MPQVKPLFGTPIDPEHPLARGLIACYLFNEQAGNVIYDYSGYGNNAIVASVTSSIRWPGSPDGGAVFLSGTYFNCGNNLSLRISGSSSGFSIFCYINQGVYYGGGVGGGGPIIFKSGAFGIGTTTTGYVSAYLPSFGFVNPGTAVLKDGQWHSIGFVASCSYVSSYSNFYLDGVSVYNPTLGLGVFSNQFNMYLGLNYQNGSQTPFSGTLANIMIWNRILSYQEIISLTSFPYDMFRVDVNNEQSLLNYYSNLHNTKGHLPTQIF